MLRSDPERVQINRTWLVRIQHSQVNEKRRSPCHALNAPGVNRHGSVAMNQPIEDVDFSSSSADKK